MFRKSTLQLDETINDLVKILVIKSNARIGLEEVNFDGIFSKVTNMLSSLISQVAAEINIDFSEWPTLISNSAYMESIFMNLLTNAIKYRDQSRILVVNAYSRKNSTGDGVCLYFEDNGLGIDLVRNKNKIFGLHQRFHEVGEGNGIGLYLIQSQIKALNGNISVESEVGTGTTFKITFNN
jgi:signal transduction histidine kinase